MLKPATKRFAFLIGGRSLSFRNKRVASLVTALFSWWPSHPANVPIRITSPLRINSKSTYNFSRPGFFFFFKLEKLWRPLWYCIYVLGFKWCVMSNEESLPYGIKIKMERRTSWVDDPAVCAMKQGHKDGDTTRSVTRKLMGTAPLITKTCKQRTINIFLGKHQCL